MARIRAWAWTPAHVQYIQAFPRRTRRERFSTLTYMHALRQLQYNAYAGFCWSCKLQEYSPIYHRFVPELHRQTYTMLWWQVYAEEDRQALLYAQ
jgi:hypothetical protein